MRPDLGEIIAVTIRHRQSRGNFSPGAADRILAAVKTRLGPVLEWGSISPALERERAGMIIDALTAEFQREERPSEEI